MRVLETKTLAPERSQFFESVEMAVFGSFCSLFVATLIVSVSGIVGLLDAEELITAPRAYVAAHAAGVCVGLFVYLALSNLLGFFLASKIFYRDSGRQIRPGQSAWTSTLADPPDGYTTIASVALRDGMQVYGVVDSVVSDDPEDRELALRRPIAIQSDANAPVTAIDADVLVLRERDVSFVTGKIGIWSPPD